ncbi:MAG: asparagine synthase (glutamine-hydrolyzing) [Deltaproteobacteria bacterium]|nr:asparagine synthase (glutamine-hydrolyzing) [Deltaproteobacteria bacterium]
MCGVTGFWASSPRADAEELLRRMSDTLRHRGPDASGDWHDASSHVALGHRRLSILDLSPAGHQPMVSASGRWVITFNGEVYNFTDLRGELERAGHAPAWRGRSDTEVMLAAVEAWGLEAAVQRFIGMFAFALFDTRDRVLHLVRDRVGIKPLYWTRTPQGLAFGSELKPLHKFPGFDTTIDRASLAGYLRANCVPGEHSIFVGTRRQPPGTILSFTGSSVEPHASRYWDPWEIARAGQNEPFQGSEAEAVEHLDGLLRDAVRLRMVADVPLGAFLSGGVDSSTVVALMQAQSDQPIHTFSIENELAAYDEGDAARAVARHLNTHHTALMVSARDALDVIPQLPTMYDEPFADSSQIPTFLVSKLARRDVTVALSGDGGDELFGGYMRHVWSPRVWSAERRLPRALRSWLAGGITSRTVAEWDAVFDRLGPLRPRVRVPGLRMHKLASVLDAASPTAMYEALSSHWVPSDSLLSSATSPHPAAFHDAPPGTSIAHSMMLRDLTGYLADDILTKVDRASMAVSLEAREPLLDHRLIAFAWRLPLGLKVRGTTGKWILRQVLARYVPPTIISGAKMGFGVPLGAWLRGPLREWAEDLLGEARLRSEGFFNPAVVRARWSEQLTGSRPWEYHLWDVLMFQAWRAALS